MIMALMLWAYLGLAESSQLSEAPIPDLSGKNISITNFKGSYVLVHFWATWCLPCREELPYIEFLNQRLKTKPIQMILVSVDDNWPVITQFFSEIRLKPSSLQLLDSQKKWASSLKVEKFPETFLIGPDGKILKHWIGAKNWSTPSQWAEIDDILTKN